MAKRWRSWERRQKGNYNTEGERRNEKAGTEEKHNVGARLAETGAEATLAEESFARDLPELFSLVLVNIQGLRSHLASLTAHLRLLER